MLSYKILLSKQNNKLVIFLSMIEIVEFAVEIKKFQVS